MRRTLPDDFARWLRGHRARLPLQLLVRRRRVEGVREYGFPAAPDLRIVVSDGLFEVRVVHEGEIDILADFDVEPKRDAAGYYCRWCADAGHAEHYPDRATLLAAHTFEPFAQWCGTALRADRRLVVDRYPSGATAARICDVQTTGREPSGAATRTVTPVLRPTAPSRRRSPRHGGHRPR